MRNIHIACVSYNCSFYVKSLYESLSNTAKDKFSFHLADHSDVKSEIKKIRKLAAANDNFFVYPREQNNRSWSVNHGEGLNHAVSQIKDDNALVMIIDIDCFMFLKNWDDILFEDIASDKLEILTTVRPFCELPEFINQPMAYVSCFRKHVLYLYGIDFLPLYKEELLKGEADKHKEGFYDVGHKMERAAKVEKIQIIQPSKILDPIKQELTKYKGSQDYWLGDKLVATHIRAGGMGQHDADGKSGRIIDYLKNIKT